MSWLCRIITCQSLIPYGWNFPIWKWMHRETFIHKEDKSMPGLKASEDRITALLGDNAAGCNWNPLWCDTVRTPGPSSTSVSTHCQCTVGAMEVMDDQPLPPRALLNCCLSEMEKYCLENNILFKILLIIDDVSGLSPFIGALHPNIKVMFLPPDTTSLIQHVDQGVIAAFKAYYLTRTFT